MRSVGAILFGFVYIFLLSVGADLLLRQLMPGAYDATGAVTDPPVLLLIMAYVAVFAISGCYLTARLAPHHPLRHAMILGLLGLVFSVAGTIAAWDKAPVWFNLLSLLLVLPYAWIGGRWREVEMQRGGRAPAAA
jgi:hypothetical protein